MKPKEKEFKFLGVNIYFQYFFYHIGLAIDYDKQENYHNLSILLPFVIIAFEKPIKK